MKLSHYMSVFADWLTAMTTSAIDETFSMCVFDDIDTESRQSRRRVITNTPTALTMFCKPTSIPVLIFNSVQCINVLTDVGSGGAGRERGRGSGLPLTPPPKTFLEIARFNRLSVRTNVGPTVHIWHYRYKLTVLLCHPVTR